MTEEACDDCLRHSALVGHLSPRLSAVLGSRDQRLEGVLALGEADLIAAVGGRDPDAARRFAAEFDPESARRSLAGDHVGAVCRHDGGYPGGLRALADVPPVVYFTGAPERLRALTAEPVATVIGARRPSRYGLEVARELGRGLAAAGVTVVSGLALGIDAASHRGVLEGGGAPLAVLAGGVDVPYPATNRALHERIAREGALLSELPPGIRPLRWSFPARNRIMAALAGLVVVVEASESSGTLITAEFAAQLGRDVGAVPGQVTSRLAAGSNRLLREGAAVIASAEDVLDELLGAGSRGGLASLAAGAVPPREGGAQRPGRPAPPDRAMPAGRAGDDLPDALRKVLDLVEGHESVAEIGRLAGLEPGQARAALGRLELMGLVARDGFAGYARTLGPTRTAPRAAPIRAAPILRGPAPSGHPP